MWLVCFRWSGSKLQTGLCCRCVSGERGCEAAIQSLQRPSCGTETMDWNGPTDSGSFNQKLESDSPIYIYTHIWYISDPATPVSITTIAQRWPIWHLEVENMVFTQLGHESNVFCLRCGCQGMSLRELQVECIHPTGWITGRRSQFPACIVQ